MLAEALFRPDSARTEQRTRMLSAAPLVPFVRYFIKYTVIDRRPN
jgi:hypothetical protein